MAYDFSTLLEQLGNWWGESGVGSREAGIGVGAQCLRPRESGKGNSQEFWLFTSHYSLLPCSPSPLSPLPLPPSPPLPLPPSPPLPRSLFPVQDIPYN
ncbi:hypothetical protein [Spirulina subsalsa]|uniref:hypothetical protein n=1 Tax=Spirulina subsalsa TaxID=54311 RepID=UPI00037E9934|nr:hypothetical protein [Spirulina subsalsa]